MNNFNDRSDYKIVHLGEENYVTWKWHMTMILTTKGLFDCVEEETPGGGPIQTDETKQCQAATLIAGALSEANMQRVVNCNTAFEIWTALEASFENKSSSERTMLLEKFHSYKIHSVSNISRALGDIQAKAAKLKSLGAAIDDETTISVILKALPDALKTWKSTWKMVHAVDPKLNVLITSLMAEVNDMEQPEDSALYTNNDANKKPAAQQNGIRNGPNNTDICNYCKKPGHWARDCRQLQRRRGHQKNESFTGDNIAMMAYENSAYMEPSQWIADSGCSMHMTPNKDYLENYQVFEEPKQITLGDNSKIPAIGSGRVITSFGSLEKVHYLPRLSHNLFSISAASKNGITAIYNHAGIELSKGSRAILKGVPTHGIYALDLKVSRNVERAFTAATLSDWHKRLGHVSVETIERMSQIKAVEGLQIKASEEKFECEDCAIAKCKQVSHPMRSTPKASKPGVSIHLDTVRPFA